MGESESAGGAGDAPIRHLWGEDVLREREELLREAEMIAHVGSWGWDMRSGRVFWSDELYRILGLDPSKVEATFEAFIAAIHLEDRAFVQSLAGRAAAGDLAERADYRVVRPDGTLRQVTGIAQVFRDAAGVPLRMVGVAADVTEARQAVAARQDLELQLRQAQKMEALGRLAGGVAHDFNNLLTIILLHVESVRATMPGASQQLAQVHDAATRAAALTGQLLAFSRHSVRRAAPLDVNAVVTDSMRLLQRVIGEDVTTRFDASATPAVVRIDENQLHQVLLNLAVNARDAMAGGGELVVTTAIVDPPPTVQARRPGKHVRLSVRDTGSGMDAAVRARIFEPFFTTKEEGRGTGLGLATVFGIVTQADGVIDVESAPGAGTTFHVYLPLVDTAAAATATPSTPPAMRGAGRILVVEDDAGVRAVVAGLLEGAGYDVVSAGKPSEAIEQWDRSHGDFALVVTDLVMPEMTGRDLLTRLRRERADLPAIFMTGYDPRADEPTPQLVGRLAKPFLPHELFAAVRGQIGAQR